MSIEKNKPYPIFVGNGQSNDLPPKTLKSLRSESRGKLKYKLFQILQDYRRENGLSSEDAATKAGVSKSDWVLVENIAGGDVYKSSFSNLIRAVKYLSKASFDFKHPEVHSAMVEILRIVERREFEKFEKEVKGAFREVEKYGLDLWGESELVKMVLARFSWQLRNEKLVEWGREPVEEDFSYLLEGTKKEAPGDTEFEDRSEEKKS